MGGYPGKRRRAVIISTDTTAQESGELEKWGVELEGKGSLMIACVDVNATTPESIIIDLYAVDIRSDEE